MLIEVFDEFITLAIHRSYTSAARALNISQSSLSRHITALEKQLGHKLVYDSTPLTLTAAGEMTLKSASDIMADYSGLVTALKSMPKSPDTHRIVVIDLLYANTLYSGLNDAIADAKVQIPGTHLEYTTPQSSLDSRQVLLEQKVDISFDFTISEEKLPTLDIPDTLQAVWVPEFHGQLCFAFSKSSPYASRKSIKLTDLANEHFAFPAKQSSSNFRNDFATICRRSGFSPRITLEPVNNPLEFYYSDPGTAIYLLSKLELHYPSLISAPLKANCKIMVLDDAKYYVNAFALALKRPRNEVIGHVMGHLRDRAQRYIDDGFAEHGFSKPAQKGAMESLELNTVGV